MKISNCRTRINPIKLLMLAAIFPLAFCESLGLEQNAQAQEKDTLHLPAILGDHMVLQRGRPIVLWGWARPGSKVEIRCEWSEQLQEATVSADGEWRIGIAAQPSGKGPYTIKLASEGKQIELNDVIFGEVWLCAGQSNMHMTTNGSTDAKTELANADYPDIRLFKVPDRIAQEALSDVKGKWVVCSSKSASNFSAVGFFFCREIQQRLNVPVGMIQSTFGGSPAEAWISTQALAAEPLLKPILTTWERWIADYPATPEAREAITKQNEEKLKAEGKPIPPWRPQPKAADHFHRPGCIFNAMIQPLTSYPIRGVIWYQGEANAPRARQYRDIFPCLIQDWRTHWKNAELPFLFVQLPGFDVDWLEGDIWAELREAQLMTWRNTPGTGMIVSIDKGDRSNIHPPDKKPIGIRLANAALALVYGKDIEFSGPIYRSYKREDNCIRLEFEHTGGGLTCRGKQLLGFTMAGTDQVFRPASARIDGNTVIVECPGIAAPEAVRYGWANSPDCNLFNKTGLPASPFRTDAWPCKTDDRVGNAVETCVEMFF